MPALLIALRGPLAGRTFPLSNTSLTIGRNPDSGIVVASWSLSNATNRIPVLLGPVQYGSDSYGVEGLYTSAATGEETSVGLLFTVSSGRGTLQRIWGFPCGQQQDLQPFTHILPLLAHHSQALARLPPNYGLEAFPR